MLDFAITGGTIIDGTGAAPRQGDIGIRDGRIVAVTRRGKSRTIHRDDPALRRARWWERIFFSRRFPEWPIRPAVEPKHRAAGAEPPLQLWVRGLQRPGLRQIAPA